MNKNFLIASERIKKEIKLPFYGSFISTSPLSEGFVIIDCSEVEDTSIIIEVVEQSINHNKTCIIYNVTSSLIEYLDTKNLSDESVVIVTVFGNDPLLVPKSYRFLPYDASAESYIFVMTEYYLLRRYFISNLSESGTIKATFEELEVQTINCIGLPPLRSLLDAATISMMEQADHIILFDRTRKNIVPYIKFQNVHIVTYDYHDYNKNILHINNLLTSLQLNGIMEVTLLVEGHPEIYDLIECLPRKSRIFNISPSSPLLFYAVEQLEVDFKLKIFEPMFILTSGYNARQGITTSFLKSEIETFLKTETSVLVMEMFLGDLPLILKLIQGSSNPKSVFILTNMFSEEQKIFFISKNRLSELEWINEVKGKFTSLIIIDDNKILGLTITLIKNSLKEYAKI